jgi:mediator of RNA polymerase II transcription subunit 14
MEEVMRYRLRISEFVPIEMARHRIGMIYPVDVSGPHLKLQTEGGRVYFTIPKLFETSICLRGAEKPDGWFFVHVEFLISIGGDLTSLQGLLDD